MISPALRTLAFLLPLSGPVLAQDVVVGVNVVNPMRASVADQNVVFDQLEAAEVHVIRCGISNDDKGIDFAKRAAQKGIRLQLIVGPQYFPNAPVRPYQPQQFPAMWGGPPLSYADPELSKAFYQKLFDRLDARGIALAGIELGNEINWAAFNPEFPLPGEAKILSLSDLSHDPEGKQIAKGFLQYLKILAVLKEVRDHSRLNSTAPIISAGMVSAPDGEKLYNNKREDMVSLPATMAFLRAHGLDSLVDAYGIHTYPSPDHPGDPAAAARRAARFESVELSACRAAGQRDGKPCWFTEWGFADGDFSCPPKDSARTLLVEQMRLNFAKAAAEHRLAGITYFAWSPDPWSKADANSIYRCGGLTESGRLAIAPLTDLPKPDWYLGMRVRVGVPLVARGPAPNIADSAFTAIQLPNGKFRGFTAAGTAWAIDGNHPYDMGGAGVAVLKAGPAGSPDSCGQWINHVEQAGATLFGWVHNETACNYAKNGQTHASMTLGRSSDLGLTWKIEGLIISSTDPPADGKETGDSCGTVVRGQDGYDYAYCAHNGGHSWDGGYGFVARAPVSDPGPGRWKKYFNGSWSEPGIGGKSSPIDGAGSAWWNTTGETLGLKWVKEGGLGLVASSDHLHFKPILPPRLMLAEPGDWSRKNGLELIAYPDLIDAKTGLNQLDDHWLLAYMYLSPGDSFNKRYLVFRPVDISWSRAGGEPQVGEMLTHWYSPSQHDHWATTAPVPGNYSSYRLVAQIGYMMTVPDPSKPTVELEECVSKWPGHPDHILIEKGVCETRGYQRLRGAGFIYSIAQATTQPLYRCYSEAEHSHFASNREDCENMGKREALLGYDLKQ
jgi:hypothetical protein